MSVSIATADIPPAPRFSLEPDMLLTRRDTARALAELGFPVPEATLVTLASRGGGPPYQLFGRHALYRWGETLAWAQSRLRTPALLRDQ